MKKSDHVQWKIYNKTLYVHICKGNLFYFHSKWERNAVLWFYGLRGQPSNSLISFLNPRVYNYLHYLYLLQNFLFTPKEYGWFTIATVYSVTTMPGLQRVNQSFVYGSNMWFFFLLSFFLPCHYLKMPHGGKRGWRMESHWKKVNKHSSEAGLESVWKRRKTTLARSLSYKNK